MLPINFTLSSSRTTDVFVLTWNKKPRIRHLSAARVSLLNYAKRTFNWHTQCPKIHINSLLKIKYEKTGCSKIQEWLQDDSEWKIPRLTLWVRVRTSNWIHNIIFQKPLSVSNRLHLLVDRRLLSRIKTS